MTNGKITNLFSKRINFSESSYKAIVFASLYAVLVFLIFTHHEFWRDELNTWLAVKNLDLGGILRFMAWDGHPFLHYFVLMFFAKTAGNPFAVRIFFWLLSFFSVFLLARFSPFPLWLKIAISFSPAMAYYYPAFMRNYAYIPLLLFSICGIWPAKTYAAGANCRSESGRSRFCLLCLLIVLLAGTHSIMFIYAAGLLAVVAYDNIAYIKKCCLSAIIPLAFSSLAMAITAGQLVYASRVNPAITQTRGVKEEFIRLFSVFLTNSISDFVPGSAIPACVLYFGIALVIIAILYATFCLFSMSRKHAFVFLSGFLFQICVYFFAYGAVFPVRVFSIPLMLVSSYWIISNEKTPSCGNKFSYAMLLLFLLPFPSGYSLIIKEFKMNFSSAEETALFIDRNIDAENSAVFAPFPNSASSVAFYLKKVPLLNKCGSSEKYMLPALKPDTDFSCAAGKDIYIVSFFDEEWHKAIPKEIISRNMQREYVFTSRPAIMPSETFFVAKLKTGEQN